MEKVPIRGYVVIKPDTPEAARLIAVWQDNERPQRYFVPVSWIDICRARGKILPRIFVENARAVKIHLHKSIANLNTRDQLADLILVCHNRHSETGSVYNSYASHRCTGVN